MPLQSFEAFTRADIPQPHSSVCTATGEGVTIGLKALSTPNLYVPAQVLDRCGYPTASQKSQTATSKGITIRTKGNCPHFIPVSTQDLKALTRAPIP